MIAVVVAVAAVAGLAALAASRGGSGQERGPRQADLSTQVVTRGALTMRIPPGWSTTAEVPRLPGMSFSRPITVANRASNVRVAADTLPATSETLLPAGLVASVSAGLPTPDGIAMGHNLRGYHYAGLSGRAGRVVDLYVAPTTEGVVTVVCLGQAVTSLLEDCWSLVSRISLSQGRPLPLGSGAAFRQRLLISQSDLNAAEAAARRQLADAATTTEQAEAVSGLPAAYRDAAAALAPLVPGSASWPRQIVASLEATAAAYVAFESSLRAALPGRYADARDLVRIRRARLKSLLADALRSLP